MSNIILQPFTEGDSDTYFNWVNNTRNMQGLSRVLPVTIQEHKVWYRNLIEDKSKIAFSICLTNQSRIGMVYLNTIDWIHSKAEIRILIGPEGSQRKGYGKETLASISSFAFYKLGLNKLYAYILENNTPSIKAFEGTGFLQEARLKKDRLSNGEFIDVFIYSKWK